MTTIVRWNPIREMAAMQSAMDRLFEQSWRGAQPTVAGNALALDVYENDQAYLVHTSLPGVNADQINISFQDDVLTISGEVEQANVEQNTRVLLSERSYGKFSRSIRLAQAIDADKVEATYENGVLSLTLPKAPEAQPRMIPVKTNGVKTSAN
ncbi:MAG: Hsp20/alpha crystallin family protein [Anaerolineae bacterium]|nr:Hsp20/alpha crystallin family protein [Anaerolineae bacterium]